MNASERFCHAYTQYRGQLSGQPELVWLQQLQDQALENFAAQGLPGPKSENWKYTRLKAIEKHDFERAELSPVSATGFQADTLPACPDSLRLVFINGRYQEELSSQEGLPDGLILCSFAKALKNYQQLISPFLGKVAADKGHPFAALNAMYMADGLFLSVPAKTKLHAPIHCLFYSQANGQPIVCSPRILMVLEEQAEATVIEHYLGHPTSGEDIANSAAILTNVLTEISLGREAKMQHYKLQSTPINDSHIAGLHVEQQHSSLFSSHHLSLGSGLTRNDIHIKLSEENAECSLYGAYCIGGKQHVDNHTQIDHYSPGCRSRELYKGIIQDRARAVFNGMIEVHPDAQKSDAQLINKNLLLSAKAEVDTKPELQIYADDVKCSHGATVGQLDPAALFYLQSRGIAREQAEALLAEAFISEIIDSVKSPAIAQFLNTPVLAQLGTLIGSPSLNHTASGQGQEQTL